MSPRDSASVLLAAGASSRLGTPKQLLRIKDESLLRRTARLAIESGCLPNLIVLGAHAEILKQEISGSSSEILENSGWQEGMGSTIRVAMKSLLTRPKIPGGVLLLVCDQPQLSAELLAALLDIHAGKRDAIVASHYGGVLGVPAVFGSDYFEELAMLSGDSGARRIISMHREHTRQVEFVGGNFDLDLPEDVVKLRQANDE